MQSRVCVKDGKAGFHIRKHGPHLTDVRVGAPSSVPDTV